MTKTINLTSSFLILLLQSKNVTFKKHATEELQKVFMMSLETESWFSKGMSISVATYFVYYIWANNFFGGPVTFEIYWPPGPVDIMSGHIVTLGLTYNRTL